MSYCQRAVSVRQSTSDIGMTKGTWVATDARMACGCWCSENGQVVGFRLCPANAIVHLLQPGRLSGSWLTGQLFFFSYVAVVAVRGLRVLCLALLSLIDVHAFHLLSLSSNWSLTLAFGRLSDEAMAYSYIFFYFFIWIVFWLNVRANRFRWWSTGSDDDSVCGGEMRWGIIFTMNEWLIRAQYSVL